MVSVRLTLFFLEKSHQRFMTMPMKQSQVTGIWRGFPIEFRVIDMYPDLYGFSQDEQIQSCLKFLSSVKLFPRLN